MALRWMVRTLLGLAALILLLFGALRILTTLAWRGVNPGRVERLWPAAAPGALGATDADVPEISAFLPAGWHSTGAGMVICPGGAYRLLMSSYEGDDIARWLNSFGVAGFVLKYRIAPRYRYPAPFLDAARAVRFVRYHAARYGLHPDRIGIIGFSAGGHLASTVITHFDAGNLAASDPVDRVSSRPDFAILGYPVITLEPPWTHEESVRDLLGPNPDPALVQELSNDRQVTPRTPAAFLFHTSQDAAVPAENSVLFYSALRRNGVETELHIFKYGPHGAGLANGHGGAILVPSLRPWSALAERWLGSRWPKDRTWSYSALLRM
jgi:acetyl esterase/lipase